MEESWTWSISIDDLRIISILSIPQTKNVEQFKFRGRWMINLSVAGFPFATPLPPRKNLPLASPARTSWQAAAILIYSNLQKHRLKMT